MGDRYVLDEFKRHSTADEKFVKTFLQQWNSYLLEMQGQVSREEVRGKLESQGQRLVEKEGEEKIGRKLSKEEMDKLSDAQVGQLWALRLVCLRDFGGSGGECEYSTKKGPAWFCSRDFRATCKTNEAGIPLKGA